MSEQQTSAYYDALAPYYRYLFPDWEASIARQAEILDGVIREFFGEERRRILDAACGIGTQALGLAARGYAVTGTDISPAAVEQARWEAAARGLSIEFLTADMRALSSVVGQEFDVVIACDNAIPHLLSDEEILVALREFYRCVAPGGGCLISVRDYGAMEKGGTQFYPRVVHQSGRGRLVLFDVREFEGDHYDFTTYLVKDEGAPEAGALAIRGGRYYCVTVDRLETLLAEAGFSGVVTLRDRFYQPLLVGRKA